MVKVSIAREKRGTKGRQTVLCLVGFSVVHCGLHIAAAVGLLDHGRLVSGETAVHVDFLGRAEG